MLVLNAALILVHPGPNTLHEGGSPNLVAIRSLRCQQALYHGLGSDAGVIFARHPESVVAAHAVIADQDVFNGGGDGVSKVECTRYVGWRHADDEGWAAAIFPRFE